MSAQIKHATDGTTLADLLERILDKGLVIAGDIKISIVEFELLSIQIRLLICSVDKAKEIGMDWWKDKVAWKNSSAENEIPLQYTLEKLENRLSQIETLLTKPIAAAGEDRK